MKRLTERSRHAGGSVGASVWLLAGALFGSTQVRAADVDWGNVSGGTFSVGTNWIGGVVPGTSDFAHFGRSRPGNPQEVYTVTFSTSPTMQGLVIEDDRVTLDLNGNVLSLTV